MPEGLSSLGLFWLVAAVVVIYLFASIRVIRE